MKTKKTKGEAAIERARIRMKNLSAEGRSVLDKRLRKLICLHSKCSECGGSGVKKNGDLCLHFLSCSCKKCNPSSL